MNEAPESAGSLVSAGASKNVPQDAEERARLRQVAAALAPRLSTASAPDFESLKRLGRLVLAEAGQADEHLGYAMVLLCNAYWERDFAGVPFSRRLFLLPQCLREPETCPGKFGGAGLECAGCGSCGIGPLKARAESLGYQTVVAEGTAPVLLETLERRADALLGVACLDSLEKAFGHARALGIPHLAVPLLSDGCARTQAETGEIERLLDLRGPSTAVPRSGFLPLLRTAIGIFEAGELRTLLEPQVPAEAWAEGAAEAPLRATEAAALDWLVRGGKRLRPFIVLAAYAVARHGRAALSSAAALRALTPRPIRRAAVAVEILHKASLIHDDIEDRSPTRYGRETLHRRHGLGFALNAGDYLIGLGYRLLASLREDWDARVVAEILERLAEAHLALCRGQGAELTRAGGIVSLRAAEVLRCYALKTVPAFEVALEIGLRGGGETVPPQLRAFCAYLGEGYQVANDLQDWEGPEEARGRDALARRPTILRALAVEAGAEEALAEVERAEGRVAQTRRIYEQAGVFERAEKLRARFREQALRAAEETEPPALRELLEFLARTLLP